MGHRREGKDKNIFLSDIRLLETYLREDFRGIIDDMDETINSLVEASYLPISVIIIGIGDADFTNMNRLDADEEILCDESGRIAERDLVQFVPFKDFKNDGEKLAEQVLEEIPRQIVEFFSNKNIPPGKSIPGMNF